MLMMITIYQMVMTMAVDLRPSDASGARTLQHYSCTQR